VSLVSFADHSITIIRPGRYQDHGSWFDDWDNPASITAVGGCVVFPGVSTEDNDRQDAQKVAYTVYAPEGTDITAGDKVRVDLEPDLDLAVYGRPRRVPSPTGALAHVQIELSDWEVTG
jgi:hypothetical protein